MNKTFVRTQNVKNFVSLINSLQNKAEGIPRMALVYGEPGLGKTQTVLWWATQNEAVYVRSSNLMSGRWFLEELVEELGETPYYKTSDLFKQCIKQLRENRRIIIVDKVDYLVNDKKAIETIRDIHDQTDVPIVLVGMGLIDKKLIKHRHLYDRISEKVKFEAFSLKDVQSIISELSEIEMTECAIRYIYTQANRLRQIVKLINQTENICKMNGLSSIDEKTLKGFLNYDGKNIEAGKKAPKVHS